MSRLARYVLFGLVWSFVITLLLGSSLFSVLNRNTAAAPSAGPVFMVLFSCAMLALVTVGVLAIARRSNNPVGWIIIGASVTLVVSDFAQNYAVYALFTAPGSLSGGTEMAWLSGWISYPAFFTAPALLFLLFPDGRLLSPRWRVVLWMVIASTGAALADALLSPVMDDAPFAGVRTPLGISLPPWLLTVLGDLGWPGMVVSLLAAAASMVVRLRHAQGIERQQVKWIASAAASLPIGSAAGVGAYFADYETVGGALVMLASVLVPLIAGYAILRYRLYDIDIIIRRTLVYSVVSALLLLTYGVSVVALQRLVQALTGSSSQIAVVASTLLIAALFGPLRHRVQQVIDRRFFRQRYDAAETVDEFSSRLRDATDVQFLTTDLLRLVDNTLQPVHVSLWIRSVDREVQQ